MLSFQTLNLVNIIVIWGVAIALLIFDMKGLLSKKTLQIFTVALFFYLAAVAWAKTYIQWNVWSNNPLTKHLLSPENAGYFSFYALTHFFYYVIFAGASAFFFGAILYILQSVSKSRLLSTEEAWLGIVVALLVGWPGTILLTGFTFISMLLAGIFMKRVRVAPYLYASLVILLIFGARLVNMLGLKVIKV